MADIAFDATSDFSTGSAPSITVAFTVGSGSQRFLAVEVMSGAAGDVVTGVTYNGVAMVRAGLSAATTDNQRVYLYVLANPSSGANNIVVSATGVARLDVRATSYTGCSGSYSAAVSAIGAAATTLTVNITTVYDRSWVIGAYRNNLDNAVTAGANTTIRDGPGAAGLFSTSMADSNGIKSPAGATSLTWNWTSATTTAAVVIELYAARGTNMLAVF